MPNRSPVLDGLRALSILLVLAAHMLPIGPKFLQLNHAAGAMGMSLFFGLSGFLIVSTLLRHDSIAEFIVKRLARIVPLAYAYAIIVFSVLSLNIPALLWTGSFVLNYQTEQMNSYNAHYWSLCVEVHFYLATILVFAAAGRRGLWIVWPACAIVTILRIHAGAYTHIETHLRVDEILAGACVATVYRPHWCRGGGVAWMGVVFATFFWFVSASPYTGFVQYLRPYATALLLTAVLANGNASLNHILTSRPLRYIARISYALYIVHPLTIQGWLGEGSVYERYFLKRPISFIITFAVAHLSTFYWEASWIQAAKNWGSHKRLRGSAAA